MFLTISLIITLSLISAGVMAFTPFLHHVRKYHLTTIPWLMIVVSVVVARQFCLEGNFSYLPFLYIDPSSIVTVIFPAFIGMVACSQRDIVACIFLSFALLAASPVLFAILCAMSLMVVLQKKKWSLLVPFIILPACFSQNGEWTSSLLLAVALILTGVSFHKTDNQGRFIPFIIMFSLVQHEMLAQQNVLTPSWYYLPVGVCLLGSALSVYHYFLTISIEERMGSLLALWFYIVMGTSFAGFMGTSLLAENIFNIVLIEMSVPFFALIIMGSVFSHIKEHANAVERGHWQGHLFVSLVQTLFVSLALLCSLLAILWELKVLFLAYLHMNAAQYLSLALIFKALLLMGLVFFFCAFVRNFFLLLYRYISLPRQFFHPRVYVYSLLFTLTLFPGVFLYFLKPLFSQNTIDISESLRFSQAIRLYSSEFNISFEPYEIFAFGSFVIMAFGCILLPTLWHSRQRRHDLDAHRYQYTSLACGEQRQQVISQSVVQNLSRSLFIIKEPIGKMINVFFSHYAEFLTAFLFIYLLLQAYGL